MEGETVRGENAERTREINTYLTDVGRGWEGELLSVDVEDHIGHLADGVTVDNILIAEGERKESQRNEGASEFSSTQLFTQKNSIFLIKIGLTSPFWLVAPTYLLMLLMLL